MRGSRGPGLHAAVGIMASSVPLPKWLRFCPACVSEDLRSWGEPYWHRLHQVPGVEICPLHNVYLVDSTVQAWPRNNRHGFISALASIRYEEPQPLRMCDPWVRHRKGIADEVAWLLSQKDFTPGVILLRQWYLHVLSCRELALPSGRILARELVSGFRGYYGDSFLESLFCGIDGGSEHNWLLRLVCKPKGVQHPLHHILLMQFLQCRMQEVSGCRNDLPRVSDGPWLCLNPTCGDYREPVGQIGRVVYDHGRLKGTFSCRCGYVYVKTLTSKTCGVSRATVRVLARGQQWETALMELWRDRRLSLREIARRLHIDPVTVTKQATRLGFGTSGKDELIPQQVRTSGDTESYRSRYREQWLSEFTKSPHISRSSLRRKLPAAYAWLRRHDGDWLVSHSPNRKISTPIRGRVDWGRRDHELSIRVREAASELLANPGRPVRLTVGSIGRASGHLALIQKHLNKLPTTASTLADIIESPEKFAVRRLVWAVTSFVDQKEEIRTWMVLRRAGLRPEAWDSVDVGAMIQRIVSDHALSIH